MFGKLAVQACLSVRDEGQGVNWMTRLLQTNGMGRTADCSPDSLADVYHQPGLTRLLRALRLDVEYHRADGTRVFYRDDSNADVEVVDFVGGYGALLLGHAHPDIVAAATDFWSCQRANFVQGARRPGASVLARELSRRVAGEYCTVFSNSGAEAVEVALKHALLETRGRVFLTLHKPFMARRLCATIDVQFPFS